MITEMAIRERPSTGNIAAFFGSERPVDAVLLCSKIQNAEMYEHQRTQQPSQQHLDPRSHCAVTHHVPLLPWSCDL